MERRCWPTVRGLIERRSHSDLALPHGRLPVHRDDLGCRTAGAENGDLRRDDDHRGMAAAEGADVGERDRRVLEDLRRGMPPDHILAQGIQHQAQPGADQAVKLIRRRRATTNAAAPAMSSSAAVPTMPHTAEPVTGSSGSVVGGVVGAGVLGAGVVGAGVVGVGLWHAETFTVPSTG